MIVLEHGGTELQRQVSMLTLVLHLLLLQAPDSILTQFGIDQKPGAEIDRNI